MKSILVLKLKREIEEELSMIVTIELRGKK